MKITLTTALLTALTTASVSAQSLAPSAADSSFDSLAPSVAEPIESLVPTATTIDSTAFPTETGTTADPLGDVDGNDSIVTLTPTDYSGCMKVFGADDGAESQVILSTCDASDTSQQFKFVGEQVQLVADPTKCLQAGINPDPESGKYIRVFGCDADEALQKFSWDAPDGALTLVDWPVYAVVFQGTNANVNSDKIILGDLSNTEVFDRSGWSVLL